MRRAVILAGLAALGVAAFSRRGQELAGDVAEDAVMAVTGWSYPARAEPYRPAIEAAELKYGFPTGLWGRQLYQESRYKPEIIDGTVRGGGRVAGDAGYETAAQGIAQILPATAADLGVDPLNPWQAIDGGARYMRQLYDRFGDWRLALAAYNWGMGNVQRKVVAAGAALDDVAPAETVNYVAQITDAIGYA